MRAAPRRGPHELVVADSDFVVVGGGAAADATQNPAYEACERQPCRPRQ